MDFAKMFDGVPQVPQSREEFQNFLQSGTIPLGPFFHGRLVADHPSLTTSVFAAGSEHSNLANIMTFLVRNYVSAEGELCTCARSMSIF